MDWPFEYPTIWNLNVKKLSIQICPVFISPLHLCTMTKNKVLVKQRKKVYNYSVANLVGASRTWVPLHLHMFIHKSHFLFCQCQVIRASDGCRVPRVPGVVADDHVVTATAAADDVVVVWVWLNIFEKKKMTTVGIWIPELKWSKDVWSMVRYLNAIWNLA